MTDVLAARPVLPRPPAAPVKAPTPRAQAPAAAAPAPAAAAPVPHPKPEPVVPDVVVHRLFEQTTGDQHDVGYRRGRMLGKGGFAHVYEFTEETTGRALAGKVISMANLQKPRQKKKLGLEIKIHQSLVHKNIVRFDKFFQDSQNAYILMELCSQGTLLDMMRKRRTITEAEARYWLAQVIAAVQHMHSHLVIHRDLKLGNLFVHDMELRIGDFGLAAKLDDPHERKRTLCGTPNYIAPEVLDSGTGHSFEVDVWSIGVIMYTMLVGKPPFETTDVQETYKRIKSLTYTFPADRPVSAPAQALIRTILASNPDDRPSLDAVLRHEWFAEHSIPKSLPQCSLLSQPSLPSTPPRPGQDALAPERKEADPFENPNNFVHKLPAVRRPARLSPAKAQRRVDIKDVAANLRRLDICAVVGDKPHVPAPALSVSPQPSSGLAVQSFVTEEARLTAMRDALDDVLSGRKQPLLMPQSWPKQSPPMPGVWVRDTADYSDKYGLGYWLSNGAFGANFNDGTRMLRRPRMSTVDYYQSAVDKHPLSYGANRTKDEVGHDVHKKLTLLKFFMDTLRVHDFDKENKAQQQAAQGASAGDDHEFVRVYQRTHRAFMLRLAHGGLQLVFTDGSRAAVAVSPGLSYIGYAPPPAAVAKDDQQTDMTGHLEYCKSLVERCLLRVKK
eukprot:m51a1_g8162 putative polo family protein kinase (671) ;mRNA; f:69761-72335